MSAQPDLSDSRILTGGEAMVEALIENGIDTVFGIPGIQLDPLYDAFHAKRNQVRMIHTRHEQGAAFMAMGYAQSSDRTGCFRGRARARLAEQHGRGVHGSGRKRAGAGADRTDTVLSDWHGLRYRA